VNYYITTEKIITPKRSMSEAAILSRSLLGCKSPKPTVDRDEKAKYMAAVA
jgi:hypothetical protein